MYYYIYYYFKTCSSSSLQLWLFTLSALPYHCQSLPYCFLKIFNFFLPLPPPLPSSGFRFFWPELSSASPLRHLQFLPSLNHFAYSCEINVLKTTCVHIAPLPKHLQGFCTVLSIKFKTHWSVFQGLPYLTQKRFRAFFSRTLYAIPSELPLY